MSGGAGGGRDGGEPARLPVIPEDRILAEGTRDLLLIVLAEGSDADKARLRPFEHYTFALDLETMKAEGPRFGAASDELCTLVMEIAARRQP